MTTAPITPTAPVTPSPTAPLAPGVNPMFAKFDQALGVTTPTTTAAPVTSRADEIRALGDAQTDPTTPKESSTPGILDRIGTDFNTRVNNAADAQIKAIDGGQRNTSAVLQTLGEGAGFVGDIGVEGAKSALGTIDKLFSHVTANPDYKLPPAGGANLKNPADTEFWQALLGKIKEFQQNHPEASANLGAIFNLATLAPGEGVAAKGIEDAGKLATKAGDVASAAGEKIAAVPGIAKDAAANAIQKTQLAVTKGNQLPTLESAAQKAIPVPGETKLKDPLATYDEHVATEQRALKDAKADTSLGVVGARIGDAFEQVAKQRSEAGATMSSELEKIGDKPTNISGAISNLHSELNKNGVALDAESGELMRGKTSKLTESDSALLNTYTNELHSLGTDPSIAELDAFLSRAPEELKVYKAKNNITSTTNGERIIKNNLTQLRKQFEPSTGKGYLKDYAGARKQYADLSSFLEEGQPFLGKKTSAGDYAKDASLAKSSVQSVLNNGKKDWLIKLEHLTGYPAIDDATLALQAMKDAGDYRGASLLESLTSGASKGELPKVPTTLTGVANHFLGKGLKIGAQKFTGTPIEQTRRYLQSLRK